MHVLEVKSGDEASNYKNFHLLHDTGAMYSKVTSLDPAFIQVMQDFSFNKKRNIHDNVKEW